MYKELYRITEFVWQPVFGSHDNLYDVEEYDMEKTAILTFIESNLKLWGIVLRAYIIPYVTILTIKRVYFMEV